MLRSSHYQTLEGMVSAVEWTENIVVDRPLEQVHHAVADEHELMQWSAWPEATGYTCAVDGDGRSTGSAIVFRDRRGVERSYEFLDLVVSWINLEDSVVPRTCRGYVAARAGDVAEVAKRDQVFRIELERRLKRVARFVELSGLEQGLAEHDMPTDVGWLLRQVGAAEGYCLLYVPGLAELVRQWGEIASRVLVELLLQLVKAGGAGHSKPSGAPRFPGGETGRSIFS